MKGVGQGHLPVTRRNADFLIEVVKGNIPGHSLIHVFGKAIVGTTFVPVASSLKYPMPTAAVTLEVVSDDPNDTALGTGARSITIQGLDDNWEEITQTVPTNGITPVPFPIKMRRVYLWWVETSGTYAISTVGSHAGTITIQTSPGAVLWFNGTTDPYPKGQSEIAGYTVPLGVRGYIFVHSIVADSTKSVDVMLLQRQNADIVTAPFPPMRAIKDFVGVSSNPVGADPTAPLNSFTPKTDLVFMAKVTNGTASVSVEYELLQIEEGF
jgi:hypothetical protein